MSKINSLSKTQINKDNYRINMRSNNGYKFYGWTCIMSFISGSIRGGGGAHPLLFCAARFFLRFTYTKLN